MIMFLKVDRYIVLKLLEPSDAESLFLLTDRSRHYIRERLPWVDGTKEVENTRSFIDYCQKLYAFNYGFNAGIWYRGKIAGCIGHHSIDWANKKTSIGYWLGEPYQGNGIMIKSRAIPEKLGFTNEGLVRQSEWIYDHFIDHFVYGLLKQDWKFFHLNYETAVIFDGRTHIAYFPINKCLPIRYPPHRRRIFST